MSDPGWALQVAIKTALDAALSCPVYDGVPPGSSYPYVAIETQDARPDDPLASRRDERFVTLSVWSRYEGQKEVLEILADIDGALHQKQLAMSTGRMVRAYVTRKRTSREPDNKTFMGQATVRVLVEH